MKELETKRIIIQTTEKRPDSSFDYIIPVWAIIYLILMFILFCKGVLTVINCNGCTGSGILLLSLFG